jgi:hypothetical protein
MAVTLETLAADAALDAHQRVIRRAETRGYTLISLSAGRVGGQRGNLLLLDQTPAPAGAPVTLRSVGDGVAREQQEALLNGLGATIIGFGSVYVGGRLTNVVAYR